MCRDTLLLSTAYLGPVRYFALLASYEGGYIEQWENYSKQSYRNRTVILGPNGPLPLAIPVSKTGRGKCLVKNVLLANADHWQTIHWRALHAAYTGSPFFEFYKDELYPFYHERYDHLLDFNLRIQRCVLDLLELDVDIRLTEKYFADAPAGTDDMRYAIHPKKKHQEPDCRFTARPYTQVFSDRHGFVPDLSILDVLFNLGPGAHTYLRSCMSVV